MQMVIFSVNIIQNAATLCTLFEPEMVKFTPAQIKKISDHKSLFLKPKCFVILRGPEIKFKSGG